MQNASAGTDDTGSSACARAAGVPPWICGNGEIMSSPLAKLDPSHMNDEELHEVKQRAWKEHEFLCVKMDQPGLTWEQREQIRQLGEALYGKRSG